MNIYELTDEEINAIPQDKRVKIVQAQIEGGRAELADLYEKLANEKMQLSELEFKGNELSAAVIDERKKIQQKEKNNDKLTEHLRDLRNEVAKLEEKLKQIRGDGGTQPIKDVNVDRLASQLDKEQTNVLKVQAQIERRRNELAQLDLQFQGEAENKQFEYQQLKDEKKKLMDLIGMEMQRLTLLKQRNSSALKGVSSHALDAQLTAVLESLADGN